MAHTWLKVAVDGRLPPGAAALSEMARPRKSREMTARHGCGVSREVSPATSGRSKPRRLQAGSDDRSR